MKRLRKLLGVFVVLFLSSLFLTSHVSAQGTAEIILQPNITNAKKGETLSVDVLVDSKNDPVNAIQTNVMFPQDSLSISKFETNGSAFDIALENKSTPGLIRIARGVIKPVSGVQKVGTIEFSVNKSTPTNKLQISPDSAVVRSTDNKNIYPASFNYYEQDSASGEAEIQDTHENIEASESASSQTHTQEDILTKLMNWNDAMWNSIIHLFAKEESRKYERK